MTYDTVSPVCSRAARSPEGMPATGRAAQVAGGRCQVAGQESAMALAVRLQTLLENTVVFYRWKGTSWLTSPLLRRPRTWTFASYGRGSVASDPRSHVGRQRWKEKAPAALCCQSGTLRLTRGPWVMCAMRCDCDLGKKNGTAGLYFQQIFLNIN